MPNKPAFCFIWLACLSLDVCVLFYLPFSSFLKQNQRPRLYQLQPHGSRAPALHPGGDLEASPLRIRPLFVNRRNCSGPQKPEARPLVRFVLVPLGESRIRRRRVDARRGDIEQVEHGEDWRRVEEGSRMAGSCLLDLYERDNWASEGR